MFKFFHVYAERGTKRKLKCVKVDNGGEYRGPFEQYCKSHKIRLEKNCTKDPTAEECGRNDEQNN